MPLNLCTLDRCGASREWKSWLLDRFPFSKMGELGKISAGSFGTKGGKHLRYLVYIRK